MYGFTATLYLATRPGQKINTRYYIKTSRFSFSFKKKYAHHNENSTSFVTAQASVGMELGSEDDVMM